MARCDVPTEARYRTPLSNIHKQDSLAGSTLSAVRLCSRCLQAWAAWQLQGRGLVPLPFSHHPADHGICATAVVTVPVATLMPPSAPVMCRRLSVAEEQRKCRSMSGGASDRRCETRARRERDGAYRLPRFVLPCLGCVTILRSNTRVLAANQVARSLWIRAAVLQCRRTLAGAYDTNASPARRDPKQHPVTEMRSSCQSEGGPASRPCSDISVRIRAKHR